MLRDASGDYFTLKVSLLWTSYVAFVARCELSPSSKGAEPCFPVAAIKTSDVFSPWCYGYTYIECGTELRSLRNVE